MMFNDGVTKNYSYFMGNRGCDVEVKQLQSRLDLTDNPSLWAQLHLRPSQPLARAEGARPGTPGSQEAALE